jgi:hypothetical protein
MSFRNATSGAGQGPLPILARHFFSRFFDSEWVSEDGDLRSAIIDMISLLAVPGLLLPLWLLPKYATISRNPPFFRELAISVDMCFFIGYSMVVLGFITIIQWDSLFPDTIDRYVLNPLPVRIRTIFSAKVAALLLLLGVFAVAVNAVSLILFPVIASTPGSFSLVRNFAGHLAATLAGGSTIFFAIVVIQGLSVRVFGERVFYRISPYIQIVLICVLLGLLFSMPPLLFSLQGMLRRGDPALFWIPPVWFLGLFQVIAGSSTVIYLQLASFAIKAFGLSCFAFLLAYVVDYSLYTRRTFQNPGTVSGPGRIRRALARLELALIPHPVERAIYSFVLRTLSRSPRQRLLFTAYLGVGFSMVSQSLIAFVVESRHPWSQPTVGLLSLQLVLSFFTVAGLRIVFSIPADCRSNWVFRTAKTARPNEYIGGVRKAMIALSIVPVLLQRHCTPGCGASRRNWYMRHTESS